MSDPAVRLHDLTLSHRGYPAVHHLNGAFELGSMTALVGPNGAGKSTLMQGLMGQMAPSTGRVTVTPVLARRIAYLPQQSEVDRSFPISVLDVAVMGLWRQIGFWRGVSAAQRAQAHEALSAVGLSGLAARRVGELSVGQFQRLLFARVLLQDAALILLDEPFNAIDARTTSELLAVVQRWHAEGRTVVAVLHDLAQVRAFFPQTLLLARECVAWGPTAEVLQPQHLQRAAHMAQGWDAHAPRCERRAA